VDALIAAAATGAGLAGTGAMLRWPPARMRVRARAWCLITPYLITTGCRRAWPGAHGSRLPYVLSANRTDRSELVRLWCPSGIGPAELRAASDILAAVCRAAEVRVMRSRGHARLVTLEVIRRKYPERTVAPPPYPPLPFQAPNSPGDLRAAPTQIPASPDALLSTPWRTRLRVRGHAGTCPMTRLGTYESIRAHTGAGPDARSGSLRVIATPLAPCRRHLGARVVIVTSEPAFPARKRCARQPKSGNRKTCTAAGMNRPS
jgi:hypothetical protein